ncbi:tetratricopeptide repeat protein [bacterium]|nr:tetratricopeptide repeat protein [bacterium]
MGNMSNHRIALALSLAGAVMLPCMAGAQQYLPPAKPKSVTTDNIPDVRDPAPMPTAVPESSSEQPEASRTADPEVDDASLSRLRNESRLHPRNLDVWYDYARVSLALGRQDEAEAAYRHMLSVNNDLPRVKLDLAMLQLQRHQYEEAKSMLEQVKASNPPPAVAANIDGMIRRIDDEKSPHKISGALIAGLNFDTNANASPAGGQIQLNAGGTNVNIPLDGSTSAQHDVQTVTAANLNYDYRAWSSDDGSSKLLWKNSGIAYMAEQRDVDALDLRLYGFNSGLEWQKLNLGLILGADVGYNYITLADHPYMRVASLNGHAKYMLTPTLQATADATVENRNFQNTETTTIYDLRDGNAQQMKFGINWAGSENDIVTADVTLRNEGARVDYYENTQIGYSLGYTRIITPEWSGNLAFGYREYNYEAPELTIDPIKSRQDVEKTFGATLARQFPDWNLLWTLSYQYRMVDSNIINYEYQNHRIGSTVAYMF